MTNSTPHSRAFLSAIIGLLVAATIGYGLHQSDQARFWQGEAVGWLGGIKTTGPWTSRG